MEFKRILAVGAHPDDVEFGCSGTLMLFKKRGASIKYLVFSKCTDLKRNKGIEQEWEKAVKLLKLESPSAQLLDFPNRLLYTKEAEMREILEHLNDDFHPDLVFTHSPDDIHQDHSAVRDECRRVFKSCTLLGYESPRSSVQFEPNFYVVIPSPIVNQKIKVVSCYKTQQSLPYANPSKVIASLQHHGTKINAEHAEAFTLIRGVIQI